jgi:hypothetical protein
MAKPQGSRKPKSQTGISALNSVIRNTRDQVVKTVKNRYTGKSAPKNIASDLKVLMSLMNTEDKHVDVQPTFQSVSNVAPLVYGIGTCAQGTTNITRTGNSVKINKIDLNLYFRYSNGTPATTTIQNQIYNWYLVRYNNTSSSSGTSAFPIADFLTADSLGNYTAMSFPNPDLSEDFQIMGCGQASISLNEVNTVNTAFKSTIVNYTHPCSYHQTYNGAANTAIVQNMTFLVITCLNGANAGGTCDVTIGSRMWFIDN